MTATGPTSIRSTAPLHSRTRESEATMKFEVKGTVLPVLEAVLQPGETVVSTHGDLGWMTPSVTLSQTTQMGSAGGRGFMKAAKRVVGGAGLFLTRCTAESGPGTVVFASKLPGNII